jgi:hypothetical protein
MLDIKIEANMSTYDVSGDVLFRNQDCHPTLDELFSLFVVSEKRTLPKQATAASSQTNSSEHQETL